MQATDSGDAALAMQAVHHFTGFGEGTIVGGPVELQSEPRDIQPLHAFSTVLILVELLITVVVFSYFLLILMIGLLIVGLFFNGPRGLGLGCLGTAIGLPLRVIRMMWQPLREAFNPGSSPRNMRRVREYRLNLASGTQDTFTVKGDLTPRTLQDGDYVQIWVGYRRGRPYFRRGQLRTTTTTWTPLQPNEPPLGLYWFIGFIALTLVLGYLFITYR